MHENDPKMEPRGAKWTKHEAKRSKNRSGSRKMAKTALDSAKEPSKKPIQGCAVKLGVQKRMPKSIQIGEKIQKKHVFD